MAPLLFLGAALGGAAAMFFFDPDKGRRRRALVRDQAMRTTSEAREFVDAGTRDLANRGSAMGKRARSMFHRGHVTDDVLVERVRAKMGRYVTHPGAIEVTATDGTVTLSGSILAHEHSELIAAMHKVPGVKHLVDHLAVYDNPEGVSELQGSGRKRIGERPEVLQENWSPGTRMLTGGAGTGLALYALTRANAMSGLLALIAGAALLARTVTNKPLRQVAGAEGGVRGVNIQKTIHINVPVERVFEFLRNYDHYPRFMRNVRRVETRPDGTSHWKVAGPAGTTVEWDSITTRIEPNQVIEWSTLAGSPVEHAGAIRFDPEGGGTRVHIQMSYNPPAGALGHVVAKLLGSDPKTELDEDMMRLKTALETGHWPRDAAAARESEMAGT